MFVKCSRCGYLTPEHAALCKQCGAVAMANDAEPADPPDAPASEPGAPAPPTWPPSPTVPVPTHAPPSFAPPPPPPPVGPVASMFPEPGARPVRRSLPTWSFVAGAVAVLLVVVLVAVVASGSGGGSGATKLRTAQQQADAQAAEIRQLEGVVLGTPDMGSGWRTDGVEGMDADQLITDPCPGVTGLDSIADLGRSVDFSQYDPGGTEIASVWMRVRDYRTVEEARRQNDARAVPAFVPCAQQYDAELTECACRTTEPARPLGITVEPPPAGVEAVIFRDSLGYTNAYGSGTYHVRRAYLQRGRFTVVLVAEGLTEMDPVRWQSLLQTVDQRLALNAPTT